jgi:hypothetical protein
MEGKEELVGENSGDKKEIGSSVTKGNDGDV